MDSLCGKKVLVMGLGVLGGGVATTKWLVKQGAVVTVTDLRTKKELAPSIKALGVTAKKIRFALGKHDEEDFRTHEFIVVNPGVPKESPYLKIAKKAGARIINDAVLFFDFLPKETPIIAVTGTRGKTTTTNWIALLLKARFPNVHPAGNTPENPLLKELERIEALQKKWIPGQARNDSRTPVVIELSSWQLEYLAEARPAFAKSFGEAMRAPDIAVITNLYPDHMNRYSSMKEYAAAKANIFRNQTNKQFLILGGNSMSIMSGILSLRRLAEARAKLINVGDIRHKLNLGSHNDENFAVALSVAQLACKNFPSRKPLTESEVLSSVRALPRAIPRFRQEAIYKKHGFLIVNDSASTSPEAAIAALQRFSDIAIQEKKPLYLIMGGTDKNLNYKKLSFALQNAFTLFKSHGLTFELFFLEGSATRKICQYFDISIYKNFKLATHKDLRSIVKAVGSALTPPAGGSANKQAAIIVFSPGAASFEKFKNEFDRGEKFSAFVKRYFVI